jgi:signal peptidase II
VRRGGPWIRALLVLVGVIAVDQLTKRLIADPISPGEEHAILPGVQFVHARNQGVAFGVLPGNSAIVIALIGLALVGLLLYFARDVSRPLVWLPTGLLLGGALSNVADRAYQGSVTDFIQLPLGWPPFNLADVSITVGVFALALVIEGSARRPDEPEAAPAPAEARLRSTK